MSTTRRRINQNHGKPSPISVFVPDNSETSAFVQKPFLNSVGNFASKLGYRDSNRLQQEAKQQNQEVCNIETELEKFTKQNLSNFIMNTSTDRTAEFVSVVNIYKEKRNADPQIRTQNNLNLNNKPGGGVAVVAQRQQFNAHAKVLGSDLAKTFEKLEKLTMLCKKRSLFDDRPIEISELTHIIKKDIDGLQLGITKLGECARQIPSLKGRSDVNKQTNTQVKELTNRIGVASKSFLNVMELRRENIKIQNERKSHFQGSSNSTSINDGVRKRKQNQPGQAFAAFTAENSNSLLLQDEKKAKENSNVPQDAIFGSNYQDTQLLVQEDIYLKEREQNMVSIESAIVDIGNVMRQLGMMVKEQSEVIGRIDQNVENAEMNIESAHGEILKYFQSVTNNRWLMVKVFGVLVTFFVIFVVFFA